MQVFQFQDFISSRMAEEEKEPLDDKEEKNIYNQIKGSIYQVL